MKLTFLIIAVCILVAGVLSLALALIKRQAYYNLRDGSPEHYRKLYKQMIAYIITGAALVLIGAALVLICAARIAR